MEQQGRTVLLVVCLWCVLLQAEGGQLRLGEDFHPGRTLLIDVFPRGTSSPTNLLFRGNMPVLNGSFAYTELVSSMAKAARAINFTFPTNFSLIDVSYLNVFELSDLEIEKKFFETHPSNGTFVNKAIFGTEFPPPQNDTGSIKDVVKDYVELSHDQLPKLMEYFHELLTGRGPTVIYSHCEAGTDRTGEVSGAYYMKFLNMTFIDALNVDNHVQNRDMYTTSRNALQWYCFYLKYVENFTHLKCLLPTS